VVHDLGFIHPSDDAALRYQLVGESRIASSSEPVAVIETQSMAAQLRDIEQEVVGPGTPEMLAGPADAPVEDAAGEHPGIRSAAVERGHHWPGDGGTAPFGPAADERLQPAGPGFLIVVDEDHHVGRSALVQRTIPRGRDTGAGLVHIAHC
jgi:hypothetical protein